MLAVAAAVIIAAAALGTHFGSAQASCVKLTPIEEAVYKQAREFPPVTWLDGQQRTLANYSCKTVVVYFWSSSCSQCLQDAAALNNLSEKYSGKGLEIITVHSPEFSFQNDETVVRKAVEEFGLDYATALDDNYSFSKAFQSNLLPETILIDGAGWIRYDKVGALKENELEARLRNALKAAGSDVSKIAFVQANETKALQRTNDLLAGYGLSLVPLGNLVQFVKDKPFNYSVPPTITQGRLFLEGTWTSLPEKMVHDGNDTATIAAGFLGEKAFVYASSPQAAMLNVTVDGQSLNATTLGSDARIINGSSVVQITGNKVYELARVPRGVHLLIASTNATGFEFYKLSFG